MAVRCYIANILDQSEAYDSWGWPMRGQITRCAANHPTRPGIETHRGNPVQVSHVVTASRPRRVQPFLISHNGALGDLPFLKFVLRNI